MEGTYDLKKRLELKFGPLFFMKLERHQNLDGLKDGGKFIMNQNPPLPYGMDFEPIMFCPAMALPPSVLIEVRRLADQAGQDVATTMAQAATAMRAFQDVRYIEDFSPSVLQLRKALQEVAKQADTKPRQKNAYRFLDGLGYQKYRRK